MTPARTDDPGTWQVPDVAALRVLAPTRAGPVGGLLHPRRALATLLALPLVLWGLRSSLPPSVAPSTGWWALLGLTALLVALTLASYVPLPGHATRGESSPCAAAALVFAVLAAVALGSAGASVLTGVPALALASMALGQRLLGAAACAPRGR